MADTKSKSQPSEGADGYRDASTTQGGPSVLPASLSMTDGCVGLVPSIACGGGGNSRRLCFKTRTVPAGLGSLLLALTPDLRPGLLYVVPFGTGPSTVSRTTAWWCRQS